MDASTHIGEYLERIIQFKHSKELNDQYLEAGQLDNLLAELTIELGFEKHLWELRKKQSLYYYYIFLQIKEDYHLQNINSKWYKTLCQHFLRKAINLDPFNQEYLNVLVSENSVVFEPKHQHKIQYLQLFKPTSTEATALMVDLGIPPHEISYDYFSALIIGPFVDEMVFLKEFSAHQNLFVPTSTLDELAAEAGVDKNTLLEIKEEIKEMHALVSETYGEYRGNWKTIHKAYLSVDKMVELDPFNPRILQSAIHFYGATLWRSYIVSLSESNSSTEGSKAFFEIYFGKRKPSISDKINAANRSLEKAQELTDRLCALPPELFNKQSIEDMFEKPWEFDAYLFRLQELKTPIHLQAFITGEKLMSQLYIHALKFRSKIFRIALVLGIICYGLGFYFAYQILGSAWYLFAFVAFPAIIAGGIAVLLNALFKNRGVSLDLENI